MSTPPAAHPHSNHLHNATPIFWVNNLSGSVEYYVNVLGFKKDWDAGDFVSVSRDRCCIFLCEQGQGHPGAWTWIGVGDAEDLAAEFQERGAKIRQPPTNFPWAYEFQAEDPDGNVLRFGSSPKKDEPFGLFLDMHGRLRPQSAEPAACE